MFPAESKMLESVVLPLCHVRSHMDFANGRVGPNNLRAFNPRDSKGCACRESIILSSAACTQTLEPWIVSCV